VTGTQGPAGDGWISSDQADPPQVSSGSPVMPARTISISPASQETGGYSPLGTKIAGTLLDAIIVAGVIGVGVIVWKKI
jgi:hypothetical protein